MFLEITSLSNIPSKFDWFVSNSKFSYLTLIRNYETYIIFLNLPDEFLNRLQMYCYLVRYDALHQKFDNDQAQFLLFLALNNWYMHLFLIDSHNYRMNYSYDQKRKLRQIFLVEWRFNIYVH